MVRAAHLEVGVGDLGRARAFYVDLLGFVESDHDAGHIYLRALEERLHHSLVLRRSAVRAVSHLAYKVADEGDLERAHRLAEAEGLPNRWVEAGEERGQGRALRVQDPSGLPVEFFHSMHEAPRLLQRYDLHRGPGILRLDHFNCQVPAVEPATRWYTRRLGFRVSELTETSEKPPRLWAAWLYRKQTVHDLALMTGRGPRLHHAGFAVPDALAVLRACDVLAGAGQQQAIERGPGRHGLSNALFVYLRDPDGNRIELYTGDYLTSDLDAPPLRWSLEDPRRATFWGHAAPQSWFDEASPVLGVLDGKPLALGEPTLLDRPQTVT